MRVLLDDEAMRTEVQSRTNRSTKVSAFSCNTSNTSTHGKQELTRSGTNTALPCSM